MTLGASRTSLKLCLCSKYDLTLLCAKRTENKKIIIKKKERQMNYNINKCPTGDFVELSNSTSTKTLTIFQISTIPLKTYKISILEERMTWLSISVFARNVSTWHLTNKPYLYPELVCTRIMRDLFSIMGLSCLLSASNSKWRWNWSWNTLKQTNSEQSFLLISKSNSISC